MTSSEMMTHGKHMFSLPVPLVKAFTISYLFYIYIIVTDMEANILYLLTGYEGNSKFIDPEI